MAVTLADRIAVYTRIVYLYEREVNAGLRRPDDTAIASARERLRDLLDIDGDTPPEAA